MLTYDYEKKDSSTFWKIKFEIYINILKILKIDIKQIKMK